MNLYLIGYRGSGKSTVGPLLAKVLLWDHVDSDEQIQILTGQTISEIFEDSGESGFREWETTIVQAFSRKKKQVVSLGGGAPTIQTIREIIKETGSVVYLKATADELWRRISSDKATESQRPSLTNLDGFAEVEKLLNIRNKIYTACADYSVNTAGKSPEEIADQIANWFDPVDI